MYCLYKHISPSGKVYVGITSQNPSRRWSNGRGYKKNKFFFNAIKKYGWDNFQHYVLFENLSKSTAILLEKAFIKYYKDLHKSYNITDGGEGTCGLTHSTSEYAKYIASITHKGKKLSEELKRKISIRVKERMQDPEVRNRFLLSCDRTKKVVYQYNLDGEFIRKFESIREAARVVQIPHRSISNCCRKIPNYKSARGFLWSFDLKDNYYGN